MDLVGYDWAHTVPATSIAVMNNVEMVEPAIMAEHFARRSVSSIFPSKRVKSTSVDDNCERDSPYPVHVVQMPEPIQDGLHPLCAQDVLGKVAKLFCYMIVASLRRQIIGVAA